MTKRKKFKKGFIYGVIFTIMVKIFVLLFDENAHLNWAIDLLFVLFGGIFYGLMALTRWGKYFINEKYLEER